MPYVEKLTPTKTADYVHLTSPSIRPYTHYPLSTICCVVTNTLVGTGLLGVGDAVSNGLLNRAMTEGKLGKSENVLAS